MTCALIQARMNSTRFPKKVLREINGKPMISYMLERARRATAIDKIILVTSTHPSDDALEELCEKNNILCYRGSMDDVLDRYYQAARKFKADTIVRLTGDCPLIDPIMIDELVSVYKKGSYDYVANTIPPKWTVPEGMDVEVFSFKNLKKAWREAKKPSEREHVTFYFWKNPEMFSVFRYNLDEDLSQYRLTVDYPEDLEVIKAIVKNFYPDNPCFGTKDIAAFLKANPDIRRFNKDIKPNQGWESAYEKDKKAGCA